MATAFWLPSACGMPCADYFTDLYLRPATPTKATPALGSTYLTFTSSPLRVLFYVEDVTLDFLDLATDSTSAVAGQSSRMWLAARAKARTAETRSCQLLHVVLTPIILLSANVARMQHKTLRPHLFRPVRGYSHETKLRGLVRAKLLGHPSLAT